MKYILMSILMVSGLFALDITPGQKFDGKKRLNKVCVENDGKTTCTLYNFRGIVYEIKDYDTSSKKLHGDYKKFETSYSKNLSNCKKDPNKTNGYVYKCKDKKILKVSGKYFNGRKTGLWKIYSKIDGRVLKSSNYGNKRNPDLVDKTILNDSTKPSKERYKSIIDLTSTRK